MFSWQHAFLRQPTSKGYHDYSRDESDMKEITNRLLLGFNVFKDPRLPNPWSLLKFKVLYYRSCFNYLLFHVPILYTENLTLLTKLSNYCEEHPQLLELVSLHYLNDPFD